MTTSGAVLPPIGPDDTAEVPTIETAPPPPRRFGGRRTVIGVVVVVVAAGAAVGIWLGTKGSSSPSPLTVTTQVVSVTTGTMKKTVSASGTIEPAQQASLNFGASGQVTAVDVTTGQSVTAGQTLATVDPSALQAQLASAQASLTAAQAQLASDQATAASASQIDSDQAQVTSAQSALTTAQTNRADAALTSTITGTVATVNLSVGQQVSGDSSASGSSAQVVVVGTSGFVVTTTVDDTQVGQVKVGDQVDIAPSGSGTPVYGTVTSVGLIASGSTGVATFPVGIAVTGNPSGLYAGTTANVSIIVQQIDNAVQVPTAAIAYSPNGQATVVVVQNGNQVPRAITTGVSSGGETQVTSGLSPGDKVLEHVVTFNRTAGGGKSLFGGSTNGPGGGGGPGGGPPGGGQIIIGKGGGHGG
jgi:RND family efflux transporter MFP subunit